MAFAIHQSGSPKSGFPIFSPLMVSNIATIWGWGTTPIGQPRNPTSHAAKVRTAISPQLSMPPSWVSAKQKALSRLRARNPPLLLRVSVLVLVPVGRFAAVPWHSGGLETVCQARISLRLCRDEKPSRAQQPSQDWENPLGAPKLEHMAMNFHREPPQKWSVDMNPQLNDDHHRVPIRIQTHILSFLGFGKAQIIIIIMRRIIIILIIIIIINNNNNNHNSNSNNNSINNYY